MAYEVVMPYHLHMPSYFLETFTEYPYIDYDTGESIIIDYPHVNGNYFYGTIGNFDFRLEYDGGRSVKRQADISK